MWGMKFKDIQVRSVPVGEIIWSRGDEKTDSHTGPVNGDGYSVISRVSPKDGGKSKSSDDPFVAH